MKLSKNTLNILKNLASINTNLLFRPGNKLLTVSSTKSCFAEVEIEENIPLEWGCYDLNELLGVISVFNDPDIEFSEKALKIHEGKNMIRYGATEKSVLVFPKGSVKFPEDAEVTFELSSQNLQNVVKTAAVLKVPFMSVVGDGETIQIVVHDKSNDNSNRFSFDVGTTDKKFEFHFKVEGLKMLHEAYQVTISSRKIAKFVGDKKMYVLTCETDSTYEG